MLKQKLKKKNVHTHKAINGRDVNMKLCAIFCVWDDWEMLSYSIKNIKPVVDGIIVVYSRYSNYGEHSPGIIEGGEYYNWEPNPQFPAMYNETAKRNYGLELARRQEYTHFIMMDADEFYEPHAFARETERFHVENIDGLVCATQVYFKSPKLTIGLDITLVPFIHKITPTLKHEFNRNYPFAWDKRQIRIDPTRSLNINTGVSWSPIVCHHYSWCRRDYAKKIRNSTARANLERSTIMQDLAVAKEGAFCNFYGKTLIRASVDFKIPEFDELETKVSEPVSTAGDQKPG